MKRLFKHQSYFLLIGIFLFLSCQVEEMQISEERQKHIRQSTKISFSTFKKLTGLSDFSTVFTLPKSDSDLKHSDINYIPNKFTVETDQIIQTVANNKMAFAFLMTPIEGEKEDGRFFLVVYNKDGNWLDMVITSVVSMDSEGNLKQTGFREIYASPARGTGCVTIFKPSIRCKRKGKCTEGVCDQCSLCIMTDREEICKKDK